MTEFNRIIIAIIIAVILVGIIYYLNKRENPTVPNQGTIGPDINLHKQEMTLPSQTVNTTGADVNNLNNLTPRKSASNEVTPSDPLASRHQVLDDNDFNFSHGPTTDTESEQSNNMNFVHKKQKYVKKTRKDIDDKFDALSMLPKEDEDWWDTTCLAKPTKINGTHMIHPKQHMGMNTVGTRGKNPCLDIRGNIPVHKKELPFGNPTMDYDGNPTGLCNAR